MDFRRVDALPPYAFAEVERLKELGQVAILSDGDVVFQPRKVDRAGLAAAVDDNVLIYVHKDDRLADVTARFPGPGPVFVDDKARILGHVERELPDAVTVHVAQGSHANEPLAPDDSPPDIEIAHIVDLPDAIDGR